ncbi:MAG: WD40/YVTN/BNR-like repeat-containing protein [Actinomycetota bacterium]
MHLTAIRHSYLKFCIFLCLATIAATLPVAGAARQPDASQFSALKWRLIGPFRAGRVTAVAGVPGDPNTYYFGAPGGGVWKSTDAGRVWQPIFDKEHVASIGALAVAPSNPHIVYVGTGEQTRGNGLYRSSDGGATWHKAGLDNVLFIQAIVVDPHDPNVVVVAANSVGMGILWQPLPRWAKTANRGIFKTMDGGKTWTKAFRDDSSLGIVDMCADPGNPRKLYAVVYQPASGSGASRAEATSEIVESADEGSTWKHLHTKGLPEKARKRMGIAVAPGNGGRRLYAILDQGFFRSDDGGATWRQSTKDPRVVGSQYFSRVFADPNHPDVLYVAQTSLYRSTDGGKTFEAYVGAPSGDDFHVLWIDPRNSNRMLLGVDQGAIITVDGGNTWTTWYNQPTGQFYHVSTDNQFPYRVYGAQQDSGTAGVLSRSDYGQIMPQDWYSIGGFEYAYIAPDPAHPNFVYSGGWYGSVVRFDKRTGQVATVFEDGKRYRSGQMPPLVFSPQDPLVLYLGTQFVMKTQDGGMTWQEMSPDLTGYVEPQEAEGKAEPGRPKPPAITALTPSTLDGKEIWVGTSNRLVYLTRDGGANWQNVSPSGFLEPMQILYVEASHHDPATAYLTVGATRESTLPVVLRTRDYGKTWQKITNGFPQNEMVRVVREDPQRKGLLYAGTDTGVFVSWDEGDHWQSLSLNLPPTPVTDIQVHGNDLAISTFGRGLWIMDDITPLREMTPEITAAEAYLLAPETGVRVRWDNYQDTPYPKETPAGQNPPDGAVIDYFLKTPVKGKLTLTIYDEKGSEVASFSSEQKRVMYPPANVPSYWFAPETALSNAAGVNRFVWDLRYPAPATLPYSYYGDLLDYTEYTFADHAIPGLTPRQQPRGPLVAPGKYTAELRYNGKTLRQPLTVEMDPRVHTPQGDLIQQRDVALEVAAGMKASYDSYRQMAALRKSLAVRMKSLQDSASKNTALDLQKQIDALETGTKKDPGVGPVNRDLARLIFSVENADIRPSATVRAAVKQSCETLDSNLVKWRDLNAQQIPSFNQVLVKAKLPPLAPHSATAAGCNVP